MLNQWISKFVKSKFKENIFIFLVIAMAFFFCEGGCSGGGSSPSGETQELEWGQCPEYILDDKELECTFVDMPLNHDKPNKETINVLIMRAVGEAEEKHGQIWFLMGGPGESISTYAYPLKVWARDHPQWDYYAVEHRGTGASTPLNCPSIQDGSSECADFLVREWGYNGLGMFNPTQAAHDVAACMNMANQTNKRFLYGDSYGTYLTQRFAYLHSDLIDGMILDGAVPPVPLKNGLLPIDPYDRNFNDLVIDIMNRCDKNNECSNHMQEYGADSLDVLEKTYSKLENGTLCSDITPYLNKTALHQKLAGLARNWHGRMVIPALLYRINRCNSEDANIIENVFQEESKEEESDSSETKYSTHNANLNTNIVVSELIGAYSLEEARSFSNQSYASPDETLNQYIARDVAEWPVYPADSSTYEVPQVNMPVLIMNGNMDPQTPISYARYAKSFYSGTNQYLIEFPTAVHVTLLWTLMPDTGKEAVDTCGSRVFFDFLANPTSKPDSECTKQMLRPDFSGSSEHAQQAGKKFLGTKNIWN